MTRALRRIAFFRKWMALVELPFYLIMFLVGLLMVYRHVFS